MAAAPLTVKTCEIKSKEEKKTESRNSEEQVKNNNKTNLINKRRQYCVDPLH